MGDENGEGRGRQTYGHRQKPGGKDTHGTSSKDRRNHALESKRRQSNCMGGTATRGEGACGRREQDSGHHDTSHSNGQANIVGTVPVGGTSFAATTSSLPTLTQPLTHSQLWLHCCLCLELLEDVAANVEGVELVGLHVALVCRTWRERRGKREAICVRP